MATGVHLVLKYNIKVVPTGKASDLRILPEFRQLVSRLQQESEIDLACVHEAGHLFYSRRMGLDVEFKGPTIYETDDAKVPFAHFLAAVSNPELNENYCYDDERIAGIARIAVAGGEFIKKFRPGKPLGDGGDYRTFSKRCNEAMVQGYGREVKSRWDVAQKQVRGEIEPFNFEKDIRHLVEEIRNESFEAHKIDLK